jgi:hypothetical protein
MIDEVPVSLFGLAEPRPGNAADRVAAPAQVAELDRLVGFRSVISVSKYPYSWSRSISASPISTTRSPSRHESGAGSAGRACPGMRNTHANAAFHQIRRTSGAPPQDTVKTFDSM